MGDLNISEALGKVCGGHSKLECARLLCKYYGYDILGLLDIPRALVMLKIVT